jgi:4-hydroxy-tetrahydrodipicolinate reductase
MGVNIAVAGASGRMGRMLVEAVLASADTRLVARSTCRQPGAGQDAGAFLGRDTGVTITADLRQGLAGADVLIDFTRPKARWRTWRCAANWVCAVIGTTGLSAPTKATIGRGRARCPSCWRPT